jgi:hypothetical protein
VRRTRDPIEPPPTKEADPWLIPEFLWRKAQADAIITSSSALAVTATSSDLGFNASVSAERERIARPLLAVARPPAVIKEEPLDFGLTIRRLQRAPVVRDIRRRVTRGVLPVGLYSIPDLADAHSSASRRNRRLRGADADPFEITRNALELTRLNVALGATGLLSDAWGVSPRGQIILPVTGPRNMARDGRVFARHLTVEAALTATLTRGGGEDLNATRRALGEEFDETFDGLPRLLQDLISDLSPTSLQIQLGDGFVARMLNASGTPEGRVLATFLRPLTLGDLPDEHRKGVLGKRLPSQGRKRFEPEQPMGLLERFAIEAAVIPTVGVLPERSPLPEPPVRELQGGEIRGKDRIAPSVGSPFQEQPFRFAREDEPEFETLPSLQGQPLSGIWTWPAPTRPGMPHKASLEIDRRIRHAYGLEDDADVVQISVAELFEAFGKAEADLEELEAREASGPLMVGQQEIGPVRERAQRFRLAVSRRGPGTTGALEDVGRAVGEGVFGSLADIPSGREVLRLLVVEMSDSRARALPIVNALHVTGLMEKLLLQPGDDTALEDLSREVGLEQIEGALSLKEKLLLRHGPDITLEDLSREERGVLADASWEALPRPAQIMLEELFDPTNVLFVLGGAAAAPRLLRSSNAAVQFFGRAIQIGPLTVPSELGAVTAARIAFEETEGARTSVRVAAAAGGLLVGASIPSALRRLNALGDAAAVRSVTGPLERAGVDALGHPDRAARIAGAFPGRSARITGASVEEATDGGPSIFYPDPDNNAFGLDPIEVGLSRRENVWNVFRRTVGSPIWLLEANPVSGPALRERKRLKDVRESLAAGFANPHHTALRQVFYFDDAGRIPALNGVMYPPGVDGFPFLDGPTLADLAARLPLFADRLTPAQRQALEALRDEIAPFQDALRAVGGPKIGTRADIMEGGFWLPRGQAGTESGIDGPVRRARRRGKASYEQHAPYASQAHGIADGWEYANVRDTLRSYVEEVGARTADNYIGTYFKTVVDPTTGLKVAEMLGTVPPDLLAKVRSLYGTARRRRVNLVRRMARSSVEQREALRAQRGEAAGARRRLVREERLADLEDAPYSSGDLRQARTELTQAVARGRHLSNEIGENIERLRSAKRDLTQSDRDIAKLRDAIVAELDAADELTGRDVGQLRRAGGADPADLPPINRPEARIARETYEAHLAAADRLTEQIDRLGAGAEDIGEKVDDLLTRGEILSDLDQASREALAQARKVERVITDHDFLMEGARREVNAVAREQGRLARNAASAGERAEDAAARVAATRSELGRLDGELRGLESQWRSARARAKTVPAGRSQFDVVKVPELRGYHFADEITAAVNKTLSREGKPEGEGAEFLRFFAAFNNLYRGLRATLDLSAFGIQGLVGLADDKRAYGRALEVGVKAWGEGGDEVLGAFINNFNGSARRNYRLTSQQWALQELHMGGAQSEFTIDTVFLNNKLVELPLVRQANRSFGFFGDALRLSWADHLLEQELVKGRTLSEVIASGDARKIARAANGMTGWSPNKFAGSAGELLLFAPRFLEARIKTIVRGVAGLRPGASLEQRIARRALVKLIGYGVVTTVGINLVLGNKTEFNPLRPNFMRIRAAGRDWTVFGPYDGLLRGIIAVAQGKPHDAFRSLGSGVVTEAWNVFTGEDYVGKPVRPESFDAFRDDPASGARLVAEYAATAFLPFALEELPGAGAEVVSGAREGDPSAVLAGGLTIAGEIFGVKSSPLTGAENRQEARSAAVRGQTFIDPVSGQEFTVDSIEELERKLGTISARRRANTFDDGTLEELDAQRISDLQDAANGPHGDPLAKALLITFNPSPTDPGTVQLLEDLLQKVTVRGIVDKFDYNKGRERIMIEQRAKLSVYSDVFEGFRTSDNEIDRDTSLWYDLFDQAKDSVNEFDHELFEFLEARLLDHLGEERWTRVMANVGTLDPRDNPIEQERQVFVADMAESGFYKLVDDLWETGYPRDSLGVRTGEHLTFERTGERFASIYEYRDWLIAERTDELIAMGAPADGEEARQRAKIDIKTNPANKVFIEVLQVVRAEWAKENNSLALRAIAWGKDIGLSASEVNIIGARTSADGVSPGTSVTVLNYVRPFLAGNSYQTIAHYYRRTPSEIEAALTEHFGKDPWEARREAGGGPHEDEAGRGSHGDEAGGGSHEDTAGQPRSSSFSPAPSLENQMLAQLFLQGASYTAIADQTALKRGAVEQRLRRHFGGSPQRAREQFLANA